MSGDLVEQMESGSLAEREQRAPTVVDLIKAQIPAIEMATGDAASSQRLARIMLTEIRKTPKLAECTHVSLLGAMMQSAQMRLDPGPLGHCYLVPSRNKGVDEVEWWLGYKGMMELGRRSGRLTSIRADKVCWNDVFEVEAGSGGGFRHAVDYRSEDRGPVFAYYAYAQLAGGGDQWIVMRVEEINEVRDGVRGYSKSKEYLPWNAHYDAMAMKTCVRRLFTWLPSSPEISSALGADEQVSRFDPSRPEDGAMVDGVDSPELMAGLDNE